MTRAWTVSWCISGAIVVFCVGFMTGQHVLLGAAERDRAPSAAAHLADQIDSVESANLFVARALPDVAMIKGRAKLYCGRADSLRRRGANEVAAYWAQAACDVDRQMLAELAAGVYRP